VLRWWRTPSEWVGVACIALAFALLGASAGGRARRASGAAAGAGVYALVGVVWALGVPLASGVDARAVAGWLRWDPLGPLTWPSWATVLAADALVPPVPPPGTVVACDPTGVVAWPPTPAPGEVTNGVSCAGAARLRFAAPASAAPGQTVEGVLWIANLSGADLTPAVSVVLTETWIGHDDRVLAREEYPALRIPPEQEAQQRLRLVVPADVGPGEHHVSARTDLLWRMGPRGQYEYLSVGQTITISPVTKASPANSART
jgi:hypothetical protein